MYYFSKIKKDIILKKEDGSSSGCHTTDSGFCSFYVSSIIACSEYVEFRKPVLMRQMLQLFKCSQVQHLKKVE